MKSSIFLLQWLICCCAQAVSWHQVVGAINGPFDLNVYEVDIDSVVVRDGLTEAWVRYSKAPPVSTKDYPVFTFSSTISLEHFDCPNRENFASQTLYYSETFGKGDIMRRQIVKRSEVKDSMTSVIPGTYGEALLKAVCALKVNKR